MNNEFRFFLKQLSSAISVKSFGIFFVFALSIFHARILGPEKLGALGFCMKLLTIMIPFAIQGSETVLIKFVAIKEKIYGDIDLLISSFYFASKNFFILSFFMLSVYLIVSYFNLLDIEIIKILPFFLLTIFFISISRLIWAYLIGKDKVYEGTIFKDLLSPIIIILTYLFFWICNFNFSLFNISFALLFSHFFALIIFYLYWTRVKEIISFNFFNNNFIVEKIKKEGKPIFGVDLISIIFNNVDLIVLGFFVNDLSIMGIYLVVSKISALMDILIFTGGSSIAPQISRLFNSKKSDDLKILLDNSCKLLLLIGIFLFVILIFTGESILSLWGNDYSQGYILLLILFSKQIINMSFGLVGTSLNYTGFQDLSFRINKKVFILYSILLIPMTIFFGAYGVASLSSISVILVCFLRYKAVKNKLKLNLFV